MKLSVLAVITALQLAAANADVYARRPHYLINRQDPPPASSDPTTSSTTPPLSSSPPTPPTVSETPSPTSPPSSAVSSTPAPAGSSSPSGSAPPTSAASTTTSSSINTGPPPLATGTGIPPLDQISSGMPTRTALLPSGTFLAGAKGPVSGAPPLPTTFVFRAGEWPAQDRVPPVDSAEVAAWMKELDGVNVPDLSPTTDGSCVGDPAAAADAANRGWWTCGGHVRDTDITNCPDKGTWGVSFDDGPSPYTQYLLNYLDEKKIFATFFVVGSRVIERPLILIEEYMTGHEISVHTWSHRPLTSLTTAQVVAELGWTRKAIREVLGVTPTTMRPPFGDIDDRVRAIALAMGMIPIMWSRTADGGVFDTDDWRVPAGYTNGTESFKRFETILNNATAMDTGFIVLTHDLYEASVDLAVGYTIPHALSITPPLALKPIGECVKKPTSDLYLESNTNTSFPIHRDGVDTDGDGEVDVKSGDGGKTAADASSSAAAVGMSITFGASLVALVGAAFALL